MCEGELQARPGVWLLLNSQVVGKGPAAWDHPCAFVN